MIDLYKGIAKELRSEGLTVKVAEGWENRGDDDHSPIGVMWHHTASPKTSGNLPCLGICVHGRSDLKGPLCNILIGRDGTVVLIAAGRANHAGTGGPLKGVTDGNEDWVGIECENDGIGEPWPEEQYQAMVTVTAVLLNRMEAQAKMLVAHREWAPTRKPDPTGINMDEARKETRRAQAMLGKTDWTITATKTIQGGKNARTEAAKLRKDGYKVGLVEA